MPNSIRDCQLIYRMSQKIWTHVTTSCTQTCELHIWAAFFWDMMSHHWVIRSRRFEGRVPSKGRQPITRRRGAITQKKGVVNHNDVTSRLAYVKQSNSYLKLLILTGAVHRFSELHDKYTRVHSSNFIIYINSICFFCFHMLAL